MLILQGGLHTCLHGLYSCSTAFFAPVSSSAGSGLPDRQGIAMPYLQRNLLASQPEAICSSPDFLLIGGFWFVLVPCNNSSCTLEHRPQRAVLSSSLDASGACPPRQVCTVRSCITCLGNRCLGSDWGLEVPGHPVLGSLHSPSTWRKVSFGWFPLPGLPWIPPLWLMAFAPR